jgi:tRNA intron endonuclease, catalytic C-terminal domain
LKEESKQNKRLGPPFLIDRYSVCLALFYKFAQIKNLTITLDEKFKSLMNELSFKVFKHLYDQGYYIISGHKFGAEFLIYDCFY